MRREKNGWFRGTLVEIRWRIRANGTGDATTLEDISRAWLETRRIKRGSID